jgi:hypothetical protein
VEQDSCTPGSPSAEVCDGLDNDCNGVADDGIDCGQLCLGKKLIVKDKGNDATKRKIVVLSKDPTLQTPAAGSPGDPRVGGGGELRLVNPATPEDLVIPLPAGGWSPLGKNPEAKIGWKYLDKTLTNGPCKKVIVKAGKVLKAVCLGKNPAQPINFTLNETTQGALTATLTLGSGDSYCMSFGGTVLRDWNTTAKKSTKALFKAKDAPAPATCSLP